ncbi:DNA repair protein [Haemophilus paracuniculus]|uniref:DNA repair protein n=2 Tax=Haemophilus paracuniculus TaxID=734 RepID=A0A1T0AVQ4_9PAST|nr:DNA repair protein [Haemophilus paracuniculus]
MTNFIEIGSHKAVISYVPEYKMFRGKFLNTTGYCDFLADSVDGLYQEGEISLQAYLQDCQDLGIEAFKPSKQKTFTLRYDETLSYQVSEQAKLQGVSINHFIVNAIQQQLHKPVEAHL